mmetsp:Transcript_34493/g.42533  ORF Transcript_34493/g.42533 Transcript_34493/m.42533 type:complete len:207 (-) Transcript_34493:539-1159(-)|eukprot:CAMPEP_0170457332 /NCGR_PEP_ID=MMETSP0123-20130129/4660_1 /TAXON_ID=182087 /ORGANISM="Favella ehrenbergii, Strain Fehren 1" /LENGTH=206 /DNA_ID=CAMNT_0010721091 /DNA_START=1181 /DNA_END=1801 /DNA_ORIENTATION=-
MPTSFLVDCAGVLLLPYKSGNIALIECVNSFEFGLILHDLLFLLGHVCGRDVLEGDLAAHHIPLVAVEVHQAVDRADLLLDVLAQLHVVVLLMLLLNLLLLDLIVVESAHLDSLLMLLLLQLLVLDLVFDQVVEGEDVPRVVRLGFHVPTLSVLHARLRVVQAATSQHVRFLVRGTSCVGATFPDQVHRAVGNWRQNRGAVTADYH